MKPNSVENVRVLPGSHSLCPDTGLAVAQALVRDDPQRCCDGLAHQFHVISVSAGQRQTQSVHHWPSVNRLRLTPSLPRSGSIGSGFFTAQRGFGQGAIECSRNPNRCLSAHRTGQRQLPRASKTHSPAPTPDSDRALSNALPIPFDPMLAIGSRCAIRRRWHPHTNDPAGARPSTSEPMGVHMHRQERLRDHHKASEIRKPVVVGLFGVRQQLAWLSVLYSCPLFYHAYQLFG